MSILAPGYKDATDTGVGPSDAIWGNCPITEIRTRGLGYGVILEDFFTVAPVLVTPTITTQAIYGSSGLKAFGSTSCTLVPGTATPSLVYVSDGTDNNACSIATMALPITVIKGGGDVWFECSLKLSTIAATTFGFFCGLYEQQTLSAILPTVDAGTQADANFVGFFKNEAAATVDANYKSNGNTAVTIKASAATMVADTFKKFGFTYNDSTGICRWYVDGGQQGSDYVLATAAGTDFPNDVNLGVCIAFKDGASVANLDSTTIRWYRAAQRTTVA